jgi:hypothetical protein
MCEDLSGADRYYACPLISSTGRGWYASFPDPPDLVVKFQPLDIVDVILRMVLRLRIVYQREIKG